MSDMESSKVDFDVDIPLVIDVQLPSLPIPVGDSKGRNLLSPTGSSGMRSPTGGDKRSSPSCGRGRTMKEIEEEIYELRRENFDLKMRIYIMEEQQQKLFAEKDPEELQRANAALKTQIVALRKDQAEKEDLILEAAKAMDLLSLKCKEEASQIQAKALKEQEKLQSTIKELQLELKATQDKLKESQNPKFDDSSMMYAMAFGLNQNPTQKLAEEQIASLEMQVVKLEEELKEEIDRRNQADNMVTNLQSELASLQEVHNTIQEELASHIERLCTAKSDIDEKNNVIKSLETKLAALEISLKEKESDTWIAKENTLTSQLHKKLLEQEKQQVMKLQSRLESTKAENTQLQDQVKSLKAMLSSNITVRSSNSDSPTERRSSQDFFLLETRLEEKTKQLDQLRGEYTRALKTIQDFMVHNKILTRDLSTFKRKFGDLHRLRDSPPAPERQREKSGGGDAPDSELYRMRIQELSEELTSVMKERDALSLEMEKQVQGLTVSLKEKELQLKQFEEKVESISSPSESLRIEELKSEVERLKKELEGKSSAGEESDKVTKLSEELEAKKKEVEHLNEELRKRTINLQELVNTELWDKNREIEKLNKSCERRAGEVADLRRQLSQKEADFERLTLKSGDPSELEQLKAKVKTDSEAIEDLRSECEKLRKESEVSEKSRKELINACTLLTTRLEELATFLDSLLPALGGRKRRLLQEAIERSREVSRSFSFSLSATEGASLSFPILPDFSQVDFFSAEESAVESEAGGKEEASQASQDVENDEVAKLRSEMESLVEKLKKKEVESSTKGGARASSWSVAPTVFAEALEEGLALEDVTEGSAVELLDESEAGVTSASEELAAPLPLSPGGLSLEERAAQARSRGSPGVQPRVSHGQARGGGNSESDGWSEPDRDVSLARIGLRESPTGGVGHPMRSTDEESSSPSFRKSMSAPTSAKKGRHDVNEIRRLNAKVRSLEQINCALRTELRALCKGSHLLKVDKGIMCQEDDGEGVIITQLRKMSHQLEKSCNLCLEMESRCMKLEDECSSLRDKLSEEEARSKTFGEEVVVLKVKASEAERLSQEVADLRASLKEKENEALEKQCTVLELRNELLVLEGKVRGAEVGLEEARAKLTEAEAGLHEEKAKRAEAETERLALKDKYDMEGSRLRNRLGQLKTELEKLGRDHKEALTAANRRIEELALLKEMVEDEWKVKTESLQREKRVEVEAEVGRRVEAERRLVAALELVTDLRSKMEAESAKAREVEANRKLEERSWRRRLLEVERVKQERESELRRKLDAATLTTSEAVLERTRLANDKLRLQHDLRRKDDYTNQVKSELESRVAELEAANLELESRLESLKRPGSRGGGSDGGGEFAPHSPPVSPSRPLALLPPLLDRQRSNPSSGYMSDQEQHHVGQTNTNFWFPVCGRSNNNSSPDLGIESDQGRLSSLDPLPVTNSNGDLVKLEAENEELRVQLKRTREALEETLTQLTAANQKKRQVERAISRQLHKTHHILQKARVNLESQE